MCGSLLIGRLLVVGCGYVGRPVAARWLASGGQVTALTRGGSAETELVQLGLEVAQANWLDRHQLQRLEAAPEAILVAVPHRPDETYQAQSHVVGLRNLLERFPDVSRLVVLSTTGVYHQQEGEWVDEDSPTCPSRIGPQIALAGERWLQQNCPVTQATSLRLAGIYGPGRVPLLAKLRAQEPIPVGAGYLNLIHLDDIVAACIRLLQAPAPAALYVLSDGHPVERSQFYLDAARILGTPTPRLAEPDPDSARALRSESNKRINPSRILRDLKLELRYPTHQHGLSSLIEA